MNHAPVFVYMTCSESEAPAIAGMVVERRLAACANIMAPHRAVYRWNGKVESAQEVAVIFKTLDHLFAPLEAAIREVHSYECPCIVALPIMKGHGAFLEWIENEVQSHADVS